MSIWDAKAPSWANPQILDRGKRQRRDARSALPTDYLLLTNPSLERLTRQDPAAGLDWLVFGVGGTSEPRCAYPSPGNYVGHVWLCWHLAAARRRTCGEVAMHDGLGGEGSISSVGSYNNGHVQEVVRQAHEELRHLLRQRADVMRRIGTVKQTIAGLANLFGESVLSEELLELVDRKSNGRQPGFTKACRMILMQAGRAMSARDVCDQIGQKMPPMLARHKDPMASVTTVLNRLVEYGEALAVLLSNGRRAWLWIADANADDQSGSSATSSPAAYNFFGRFSVRSVI